MPMSSSLHYLTIRQAAAHIACGELSPVELVEACLARLDVLDPSLHAFITVTAEQARHQAQLAAREIRAGHLRGPLHGIPIAHKDMLLTAGVRTTAHSRMLSAWVPDYDAGAVTRLEQAGALCVGKTACHEFAFGSPGEDEAFPAARNPWNVAHVPGSSSSGSAVAVAAGMSMAATGTDTGGSVRHPAAACGIVGMKPTFGRVSLHGVIPLAPSMDHVGPLTRNVGDNALLLQTLAGYDPRDAASVDCAVPDYLGEIDLPIAGLRVGVPVRYLAAQQHVPEVLQAFEEAQRVLVSLGVVLCDIDPPGLDVAFDTGNVMIAYEAYRYHAENLRRTPEKMGASFKQRLARGQACTRQEYEMAAAQMQALRATYIALFATEVDAVISPGREAPAETMAQLVANPTGNRSIANRIYSLTGNPAITLPMGFSPNGLPLAIQMAAGHFCEPRLYRLAAAYERAAGWSERHPA